jgi:hypothetical protein
MKTRTGLIVVMLLAVSVVPITLGRSMISKDQSTQSKEGMVYAITPDWISNTHHYATGAALADLNQDGWLDLIVSNGNDMNKEHVEAYLNDGQGHFPLTPTWESADIGYNGHLDVADVNSDGWPDVAVSYLGTTSSFGPIARVYMNNEGVLSSNPDWSSSITGNAFGVAFGDVNNDGRPDLAIATGNPYGGLEYHTYVYVNENGSYGSSPGWQSDDQHMNMGALWVDADNDGWLDLATIGGSHQTEIYRNLGGTLETTTSWQTTDDANPFGIMLAAGDVTGDGLRDLFTTDNTQLGGDGYFKQYTGLPEGLFSTTHSWDYFGDYGSAVALADVNGDDRLDLATGSWWANSLLFLNQGSGLPTTPSWTSSPSTVVEKIVFGNIGPTQNDRVTTQVFPGDGVQRLFYLHRQAIQYITQVKDDGVILTPAEYTYSRDQGWLTVASAPAQQLEVTYTYSYSLDMAVTNWDGVGNYVYYNTLQFADLVTNGSLVWNDVSAGQTLSGNFTVLNNGEPQSSLAWSINSTPSWGTWTFVPSSGENLTPEQGPVTVHVTVVAPTGGGPSYYGEIIVVNQDDPSDVGKVPVWLNLSHSRPEFRLVSLKGPLGVTVTFKNIGNVSATHVNWSITVTGGVFHGINKESHAMILSIGPGQEKIVKLKPFFGLGKIDGLFTFECAEGVTKHIDFIGSQFLFFTLPNINVNCTIAPRI